MQDIEFHAAGMHVVARAVHAIGEDPHELSLLGDAGNGFALGEAIEACGAVWADNLARSQATTQRLARDVSSALASMQATEDNNADNARSAATWILH